MWARTVWTWPSRPVRASSMARHEGRLARALDAGLVDAAVPPGRLDDRPALGDGHARRLLGVDVLARPHRHDRRQRVPAVAGGDQDRVDVRAGGEELAHLGIHLAVGVAVVLVDHLLDGLAAHLPGVADRDELDVLLAEHPVQVELAAGPDADAAEHDALAGRDRAAAAQCGGGDDRRHAAGRAGRGRRLEILSPVQLLRERSGSRHRIFSVKTAFFRATQCRTCISLEAGGAATVLHRFRSSLAILD